MGDAPKNPNSTVVTTRTLLRAELSNQIVRVWVGDVTKNPNVILAEVQRSRVQMGEGQPSLYGRVTRQSSSPANTIPSSEAFSGVLI